MVAFQDFIEVKINLRYGMHEREYSGKHDEIYCFCVLMWTKY